MAKTRNVSVYIPGFDKLSPAIVEQLKYDIANQPVRKLNESEKKIYAGAVISAIRVIPAFRDAISLMRPYMNALAPTAGTDPYARVGFGYWFFYVLTPYQQASVLLHECMHVLNDHFRRWDDVNFVKKNNKHFNVAGDLEINTVLNRVDNIELKGGLLPDRDPYFFPTMLTMEAYGALLVDQQNKKEEECEVHGKDKEENKKDSQKDKKEKEKGEGEKSPAEDGEQEDSDSGGEPGESGEDSEEQGEGSAPGEGSEPGNAHGDSGPECTCGKDDEQGEGSGQGDGQGEGWGCEETTEETQADADAAGIQRASDVEQTLAKENTISRIVDERNSGGQGSGSMDALFESVLKNLLPKKVDWRKILRSVLTQASAAITRGRQDYTYRRTSRRLSGGEFIFPGMVNYLPKITLAIDTSGSMGNEDYQRLLNEVDGVVREVAKGRDSVNMFSVDTRVGGVTAVNDVRKVNLTGGGGTQMAVAWKFVKELPKKEQPDILILSTDGFIDWLDVEEEVRTSSFRSIILVTQQRGFDQAPESLKKIIPVICIDEGEK